MREHQAAEEYIERQEAATELGAKRKRRKRQPVKGNKDMLDNSEDEDDDSEDEDP